MNHTEHSIRAAFEDGYAERHAEFVKARSKIISRNAKAYLQVLAPALGGPTLLVVFHSIIRPEIMRQLLLFYSFMLIPFILVPICITISDIKRSKEAFYL